VKSTVGVVRDRDVEFLVHSPSILGVGVIEQGDDPLALLDD
jgi:hypothetical protein